MQCTQDELLALSDSRSVGYQCGTQDISHPEPMRLMGTAILCSFICFAATGLCVEKWINAKILKKEREDKEKRVDEQQLANSEELVDDEQQQGPRIHRYWSEVEQCEKRAMIVALTISGSVLVALLWLAGNSAEVNKTPNIL